MIAELTGLEGDIVWDASRPDGQPHRAEIPFDTLFSDRPPNLPLIDPDLSR